MCSLPILSPSFLSLQSWILCCSNSTKQAIQGCTSKRTHKPVLPYRGQGKGRLGGDFRFHSRKWRRCASWGDEQSWNWVGGGERKISHKDTDRKEWMVSHHLRTTPHCPGSVGCGLQASVQGIKEARQAKISPARTRRRDLNGNPQRVAKLLSTSDINVDSVTCMQFPVASLFLMMFAVLRVYNFC